ncbi:MAG TPA: molecular chaperone HtpG [Deltaproteobacteria bacterium]|nr:molecular chaperone HtpG [Deltaproteobacteria bacterium]
MSRDELAQNLGTVAHSGTLKFLEENPSDASLIGQFGVGFYSAFLVADHVTVTSKAAGADEAWTWASDAKESYTLEPAERSGRGTTIALQIGEDHKEFLESFRLRALVKQYSDYVSHPIELHKEHWGQEEAPAEVEWEQANSGSPLWQRPASELDDDQYKEFYRGISHDFVDPMCWSHFTVEGRQLFTGLLYIPGRAPFDLFHSDHRRGVRLFVKNVFILEDAEELVPVWLRFVRGVIDSDDLPLNVSREMLQDSNITRTIRKQIIKKTLDRLGKLAEDSAEDYASFWDTFGAVLKEGLHLDGDSRDRIAPLLRYRSTHGDGWTSLAEYVERMKEDQEAIYYVIGETQAAVSGSPHLEQLAKRGYEVLFMTDAIDEWAIQSLSTFDDKPLVSAMKADLSLDESEEDKAKKEAAEGELEGLVTRISSVLGDSIQEVRLSSRLIDSPACLVVPEGGHHAYLERLLRAQDKEAARSKRILEINPEHTLIRNMNQLHGLEPESDKIAEWIELLYDQVLLTEGSPIEDPNRLARRMTTLLQQASAAELSASS